MKTALLPVLAILIIFCSTSCSDKKKETPDIIQKITALPEFKRASARIDSLKATGRKVELGISIISESFYPEDSLKNLSIVLVEENYGFDQILLLEVKFDKTTEEIISISSDKSNLQL